MTATRPEVANRVRERPTPRAVGATRVAETPRLDEANGRPSATVLRLVHDGLPDVTVDDETHALGAGESIRIDGERSVAPTAREGSVAVVALVGGERGGGVQVRMNDEAERVSADSWTKSPASAVVATASS